MREGGDVNEEEEARGELYIKHESLTSVEQVVYGVGVIIGSCMRLGRLGGGDWTGLTRAPEV